MMSVYYAAEVLLVFFRGPKKSEQPTRGNTKVFRTFYFKDCWVLWLKLMDSLVSMAQVSLRTNMAHPNGKSGKIHGTSKVPAMGDGRGYVIVPGY